MTTDGLSLPPERITYEAGTRTFVEPPAERAPPDPREDPDAEGPPVLVPALWPDEAEPDAPPPPPVEREAEVVSLVALEAVVVSVDCVVEVLGGCGVEELLVDPPHAASRSASGSTMATRLRGLTVFSIDADLPS